MDPLDYIRIVEEGRYLLVPPSLSEAEQEVLKILTEALEGKGSLSELNEDLASLLREDIKTFPMKRLYTPSELLSMARKLRATLSLFGINNPYIPLKSVYDAFGLSDLEFLMADPSLEEIEVNGSNNIFVFHREYGHLRTNIVLTKLKDVVRRVERWIGKNKKLMDGRLPDGSRINIVLPPISKEPVLTIRKFGRQRLTMVDILRSGTLTPEAAAYVWLLLDGMGVLPHNVIISGNTGSGKTTTLNAFLDLLPLTERIILIEDTRELEVLQPNSVALASENTGLEIEELLVNALRMRPDRVVVGEVRGREAYTLLAAMNVGHSGMGTLHANSSSDTLRRLSSPPMGVPEEMLHAINLIIVQHRFRYRGKLVRRVIEITEVVPVEGGIGLNRIFKWNAESDTLIRTGTPSSHLDKLPDILGIPKQEIFSEVERRKMLLEEAVKRDLDRRSLIELVNRYYKERGLC